MVDAGDSIDYACVPLGGFMSLMAVTKQDQSLEPAMVGIDGFIGSRISRRSSKFTPFFYSADRKRVERATGIEPV